MTFDKLLKLAQKFEGKLSNAQAQDNMSKIVGAASALHQISLYLHGTPNLNPNASPSVHNGNAAILNFNNYHRAIVDNLSSYYDPETKQYTQQYRTQKQIAPSDVALLKKQLTEVLPHASAVASIIWFNTKDANVKNNIDNLVSTIGRNADQIVI